MNKGKIIVLILTFIFLLIINTKLSSLIFKKFKIEIPTKKLVTISIIVTILSNAANHLSYTMVLPDAYVPGMFGGNTVLGSIILGAHFPISSIIILMFFILNPSYLLSFLVSYLSSNFLLKKYLKVVDNNRKIALRISLAFLPILGIIIALLLSELYCLLVPFIGNKY
jgi:hypothetical protein